MMSDTGFDDETVQVNVNVLVPSAIISLLPVKLTVEGPTEKYKSHKNDSKVYTQKIILLFGLFHSKINTNLKLDGAILASA